MRSHFHEEAVSGVIQYHRTIAFSLMHRFSLSPSPKLWHRLPQPGHPLPERVDGRSLRNPYITKFLAHRQPTWNEGVAIQNWQPEADHRISLLLYTQPRKSRTTDAANERCGAVIAMASSMEHQMRLKMARFKATEGRKQKRGEL